MTEFSSKDRREKVFQMMYAYDFNPERTSEEIFSSFYDEDDPVPSEGFLHDVFFGAVEYIPSADELIEKDSKNWKIKRLSGVCRTALRLAVYEFMVKETPPKVAINQYIEIVKKYGDDNEPSYVNGILNRIARENGFLQ